MQQVYDILENNLRLLSRLSITLTEGHLPLSHRVRPDTSSTLRELIQHRLESPEFVPIDELIVSNTLVGEALEWFKQNTKLKLRSSPCWTDCGSDTEDEEGDENVVEGDEDEEESYEHESD